MYNYCGMRDAPGRRQALLALGGASGCRPPSLMPWIANSTLRDCVVRTWIWCQTCLVSALWSSQILINSVNWDFSLEPNYIRLLVLCRWVTFSPYSALAVMEPIKSSQHIFSKYWRGLQKWIQLGELMGFFKEYFRIVFNTLGILQAFKGVFFHVNKSMVKSPFFFYKTL